MPKGVQGRSAVSNIGVQYNFTGIAIVILLWEDIYGTVPAWASSVLTSSGFLGSIVGMLTLGYLGDKLGREAATSITLSLMAIGALGSAVLAWGDLDTTCIIIAILRFVMGVGIGGVYPLSSASSFEDGTAEEEEGQQGFVVTKVESKVEPTTRELRRERTAWANFWQQPGQLLPYLVALILLSIFSSSHYGTQFRLVLGIGCVMPLSVLVHIGIKTNFTFGFKDSPNSLSEDDSPSLMNLPKEYWALIRNPVLTRPLLGCMLSWALFDIYIYGIALYTPVILEKIFGSVETLAENLWRNVISVAVTLPASVISILLLGNMTTRTMQAMGFAFAGSSFFLLAGLWHYLEHHSKAGLFILFLLQKNCTYFGVPMTTFLLPNELFPRKVRSSCNGLAAATGKVGAFIGCFCLPYIYDDLSIQAVFYCCGAISYLGVFVTIYFIPSSMKLSSAMTSSGSQLDETSSLLSSS